MTKYKIADTLLEIDTINTTLSNKFRFFLSSELSDVNLSILIQSNIKISKPSGRLIIDESVKWHSGENESKKSLAYICAPQSEEVIAILEVDESWKNASIIYAVDKANDDYNFAGLIGEILFRNYILNHQGIEIHAAAIEYEGKGIIFSAPSGTGKSTQANLWRTLMGAKVINGDRPIVRVVEESPFVYGTPWTATSPDCLNVKAPLSAIVMLVQSPVNKIRQLKKNEIINWLLPRCFLPYHDRKLMDLAIKTFDGIIEKVPVYLLECKPDREAVELVYQCIK
jgi:hypothetical protein